MALKPRIAVVGLGSIGRRHARLLAKRPDISVELCETHDETLSHARAEMPNLPAFDSFDRMLATQPDAIVIATPHELHAEQAIRALQSGVHVLCEKPMASTLADATRLAQAGAKSKCVLSFGFNMHFHPAMARLKEIIDDGVLGQILHAHCHVGSYGTLVNSRSRYQIGLIGALLLDYVHQPDILFWLLRRRPEGVYMAAGYGGRMELRPAPNFLSITCDYDEEVITTTHLNYLQSPDRHNYEFIGDRGWVRLELIEGTIQIGTAGQQTPSTERVSLERDPVYEAEHQAFLDAIGGRRLPESPSAEAIVSMQVASAAVMSWQQQRRVLVTEVIDNPTHEAALGRSSNAHNSVPPAPGIEIRGS